jgi:hypothetical protein
MKDDEVNAQQAQTIRDYLLIERTALKRADICLIYGNKAIYERLAARAASLYKQGYFSKIIVTGGVATESGETEAEATRAALVRYGVRDAAILVESRSTNTQENIEFAREVIDREIGLQNVRSVIGLGHISAGRRFVMTLARRWPDVLAMHVSVNPYATEPRNWEIDEAFRRQVLEEWNKIAPYKDQGLLAEIDISQINSRVEAARQTEAPLPPFVA